MRCKKNIILTLEILISFLRNLIGHFTDKEKILTLRFRNITLCLLILILSLVNITLCFSNYNNASALNYSSNVGIGFTFNPTLSISLSSSDLIIDNLKPGTTEDSNSINVNVATNAAYGYTLSATAGDSLHNDTNLTHTNNTDIFSSIAIDADLTSLDTDNTWGYTSKLSNETTWGNYNGLSSSNNTVLLDNSNAADSTGSVDFKISAKASSTQPSGEYTGTINFIVVSNVAPMSLLDSFIASGAEQLNGYYKMQDMTHDICNNVDIEESELQLIDVRDNKVYWVAKLKDGNCWMTQNLDLDLVQNKTYIHADTDLGWSPNDFNVNASWTPTSDLSWAQNKTAPYYVDPGDKYVYTSNSDADDIIYNSLSDCTIAGHTDCQHYHIGNYYNWNAARADGNDNTSICPAGWRLPNLDSNEYGNLLVSYNIIQNNTSTTYLTDGFNNIRKAPLYFVRTGQKGDISSTDIAPGVRGGSYLYNKTTTYAGYMSFKKTTVNPIWNNQYAEIRRYGESIRCLAR